MTRYSTETRPFKGIWIPSEIWLDKNLTLTEKSFLAEIWSLDDGGNGCFASNSWFADRYHLTVKYVSEVINGLIVKGYVLSKIDADRGNQRTLYLSGYNRIGILQKPDTPIRLGTGYLSGQLPDTYRENSIDTSKEEEEEASSSLEVVAATAKNNARVRPSRMTDSEYLAELRSRECYAHIDIQAEFEKAGLWCEQRGRHNTRRFFLNWLNRIEKPITGSNTNGTHQPNNGGNLTYREQRQQQAVNERNFFGAMRTEYERRKAIQRGLSDGDKPAG